MKRSVDYLDIPDILESDVVLLANIYNECLAKIDPFRYNLKFTKDFKKKPWYKDLIALYRLIVKIGAKPREYIQAQVSEYRPAISKGRKVPTIRMMVSPEGVKRYRDYLYRHDKAPLQPLDREAFNVPRPSYQQRKEPCVVESRPKIVVKANLAEDAPARMKRLMTVFHINSEQDFFKDPFLIKQLPRSFVVAHPAYKELCGAHYYEHTYGLHGLELIS